MRYLCLSLILIMSGCAVVPENIQVADENLLVSYEQVVATGDKAVQKPARWGGIIAGVENKEGFSEVEMVHFALNGYGKPAISNESVGRFKVRIDGFLDPVVFESGRIVTFRGEVNSPVEGNIGEQTYLYPVIQADSYHLWRKETVYDVTSIQFDMHNGWFSPFWGHPYGFRNRGFIGRGGFVNSRVRVVERAPTSSPSATRQSGANSPTRTQQVQQK